MFLLFNPCKIDAGKYTQLLCQLNIAQMGAPPRVTAISAFK
jgi:hypothetical protein